MIDIMNGYSSAFNIFFEGMPSDIISLVVVGLALATELFFFATPILLISRGDVI